MINCFQLCTIWNYIKYSNKRRKWQYKSAYEEMQQNKHLMKGSEGEMYSLSSILFLRNKASQFKRPIQKQQGKLEAQDTVNYQATQEELLHKSFTISMS